MLPIASFPNSSLPIIDLPAGLREQVQALEKAIADGNWLRVRELSQSLVGSGRELAVQEIHKKGDFLPLPIAVNLFKTLASSNLQWEPETRRHLAQPARLFLELACMKSVNEKRDLPKETKEIVKGQIDNLLQHAREEEVGLRYELICASEALKLMEQSDRKEYLLLLLGALAGINASSIPDFLKLVPGWAEKMSNDWYLKALYLSWTGSMARDSLSLFESHCRDIQQSSGTLEIAQGAVEFFEDLICHASSDIAFRALTEVPGLISFASLKRTDLNPASDMWPVRFRAVQILTSFIHHHQDPEIVNKAVDALRDCSQSESHTQVQKLFEEFEHMPGFRRKRSREFEPKESKIFEESVHKSGAVPSPKRQKTSNAAELFTQGRAFLEGLPGVSKDVDRGIKLIRHAAELDYPDAQYKLGACYAEGCGVELDNEEAVKWYTKAAEQGHADAQHDLGECYAAGIGVGWDRESNCENAAKWLSKSAKRGTADEQYNLGQRFQKGSGVYYDQGLAVHWYKKAAKQGHVEAQNLMGTKCNDDPEEAVEWFRKAAEQGHLDAQYNLANHYADGRGVSRNMKEAVKWYTKAAEKGDHDAQYRLAMIYDKGNGVPQDFKAAFEWFSKAAMVFSHVDAKFNLAECYHDGKGVTQNVEEAVKWYTEAAEHRHVEAQFNLAVCYDEGKGVTQNLKEAVRWYTEAAEHKHVEAQFNLAVCYDEGKGVTQNYEEAVKWYTKAVERGHVAAQYNLAVCYDEGTGVTQNSEEAIKWYTRAAEKGDADAQSMLGYLYDIGKGVTQNSKEAVKWYLKAAAQGNMNAQTNLGGCYQEGRGVTQNSEEAVKWYMKAAEQGDEKAQKALEAIKI